MTSTSAARRCILLGNPVDHSMSPVMQNAAFRKLGLDIRYEAWEVKAEGIAGIMRDLRAPGFIGANVTIPHKQAVMPFLDEIDETAETIGAVNTIMNHDGKLEGTNTDWIGAVRALKELMPLAGKNAHVAGTGGAARAVIYGLTRGKGKVTILARDDRKAGALAKEFGCVHGSLEDIGKEKADMLINTTPVGMHPHEDQSIAPAELLKSYQVVFDIVYNPLRTRLLREAKNAGCKTIDGLKMLVYQGAASFTQWTGKEPDTQLMYHTAREELERTAQKAGDD